MVHQETGVCELSGRFSVSKRYINIMCASAGCVTMITEAYEERWCVWFNVIVGDM